MRRLRARAGVAGLTLLALVVFCLLWPSLGPYDANNVDFSISRQGPSLAHPLGTDQFGRDLVTRLAAGGRYSLGISAAALAIILALGFLYGAVSGLAGGKVDGFMMRILDGLLALPRLPISIVILVALNQQAQTVWAIILALSVVSWMLTARLVRGQVLVLRESEHVRAARAIGARRLRIIFRNVLPNTLGTVVVAVLLELPGVILGEAFLSVLGLGPNPPTPTWGNIALEGVHFANVWAVTLPSAVIVLFAVCANLLADAFQETLDPRREGRLETS
ncbi:MAG TPA: ABC transporter permease [Gaiellaceae bacterium]|nr:ABC transporter permease [Gaiellaceae bacterium]